MDYYYSCIGSEIKRGNGNQPLAISSIFGWILCGCKETHRNIHTSLDSTHVLRLNTENVINSSCFDKEPFELYFNKVFYAEINNKINEIKDDIYSIFKENLTFGNNVIKLSSHLKNTMKFFQTIFTCQKFD